MSLHALSVTAAAAWLHLWMDGFHKVDDFSYSLTAKMPTLPTVQVQERQHLKTALMNGKPEDACGIFSESALYTPRKGADLWLL